MEFPTLMYRIPGPHRLSGDATYDYIPVNDEDDVAACIADGWFPSIAEAQAGEVAGAAVEAAAALSEIIEHVEGDSRDALEAQAKALDIGFNARTSDTVLAQRIAAKKG